MNSLTSPLDLLPATLLESAYQQAERLMAQLDNLSAVMIATTDGFEVAALARASADPSRLAAMASSISALGLMAGEEGQIGLCQNITIEADDGVMVILNVAHPRFPLTLCLTASRDALLGQVLYLAKRAVGELINTGN